MARRLMPPARGWWSPRTIPGKLREIAALLAPHGVAVVSAGDLGLPEPEETAPDFVGNARLKALAAAQASRAAGAGRRFRVLRGRAGRRAWRGVGALGRPGARISAAAMARVRREVGEAGDRARLVRLRRSALHGRTGIPTRSSPVSMARWSGRRAANAGFGYDPMFVPAGGTQTYGEMDPDEKHAVSHRARAFAQLLAACLPTP